MRNNKKRLLMVMTVIAAFPLCRLDASIIGIAVNGACEAGNCVNPTIPFNTTDTTSLDVTLTLPDGDMYLVNGFFTGTDSGNGGGFTTGHVFQVTYEGNAAGGPSLADTITVDAFYDFETVVSPVSFTRDVLGAFGPGIASSSSASSCVNGTLGCVGPAAPPGTFSLGSSFSLSSSGGLFTFDPSFVNNFGAGSAIGSYIVWGQTAALPAATPEPSYFPVLLALGLAGLVIGKFRRSTGTARPAYQ